MMLLEPQPQMCRPPVVGNGIVRRGTYVGVAISRPYLGFRATPHLALIAFLTGKAVLSGIDARKGGERPRPCENAKVLGFRVSLYPSRVATRPIRGDLKGRHLRRLREQRVFTRPRPGRDIRSYRCSDAQRSVSHQESVTPVRDDERSRRRRSCDVLGSRGMPDA